MEEIKIPKAWLDWLDKYIEIVDEVFKKEKITKENIDKLIAVTSLIGYVQSLKYFNK